MSFNPNEEISAENSSEVLTTLGLNAVIGLTLWTLFECKRHDRSVYSPRFEHRESSATDGSRSRRPAPPPLPSGPLRWIWTVATLSGEDTLKMAGKSVLNSESMDGYYLVRFNYLCLRICMFASFWGLLVLTPLYSFGGGGEQGMYVVTLANVETGSSKMWAAMVFAYLFTWHALHILKGEHQAFAEMREGHLTHGDPDFPAQTRYTSKVENVPMELRSSVALEAYFDNLFPGQVHSAVMCLDMPGLERKVKRREALADWLERTRAHQMATGKIVKHRKKRFFLDCWGYNTDETEVDYLVAELRKLNLEIRGEQRAFLKSAQKLNAMDDRLMHDGGDEAEDQSKSVDERLPVQVTDWLDVFLSKKANAQSRWGQGMELFSDETSSLASNTPAGNGDGQGEEPRPEQQGAEELSKAENAKSSSQMVVGDEEGSSQKWRGPGSVVSVGERSIAAVGDMMDSAPELAKEALSTITFVGETAVVTTRRVARSMLYLTLGQRMSTTGFVTFRQMAACATSRQVLLAPRPSWCDCEPAPDPRNIIWEKIAVPLPQATLRGSVASFLVAIGALFWSIPVVAIQFWTSYDELKEIFPWLGNFESDSFLYSVISGYLPAATLVLLMMILPFLFEGLAYNYECVKSHSEVQRSVLTRYYLYQLANIYVTVASGSITYALSAILENPTAILEILGATFPSVAVYFLDVIIVKAFAGLPFEILRGWPLIRVLWSRKCNRKAYVTERQRRAGPFGPTALSYGWVYPTLLLVLVVCFMYAVISPFIMPAGAVYFALAYVVYKHQVLYVYEPKYESGAVFWFSVYPRIVIGLALAQLTVAAYLYVRTAYAVATLILPLPVFVLWYGNRSYNRYLGPAEGVAMETAAKIDRRVAAASASALPSGAIGEERKDGGEEPLVDPEAFEPLMYAQLALTSPPIDPDDCRPGETDNLCPFGTSEGSTRVYGVGGEVLTYEGLDTPLLGSRAAARRGTKRKSRLPAKKREVVDV